MRLRLGCKQSDWAFGMRISQQGQICALRDFAQWGLSQQAQDYDAQIGYLALPADVIAPGQQALKELGNQSGSSSNYHQPALSWFCLLL